MATLYILLVSAFSTTSGTKTTLAPAATTIGDLPIVFTAHTGNTSAAQPTDNNSDGYGGTGGWSLVNTAVKNGSADTMMIWVRKSPWGTASVTTITHAPGASSGGGFGCYHIPGMSRAGLWAIRQSAIQSNQAAGGTPTPVFAVPALTTNPVIGLVFNATNPAGLTPRGTPVYTEDGDTGYNTPATGREAMHIDSGETGTSIAWGGTSASAFCSVAIEIDTSPPPVPWTPSVQNTLLRL